MLKHSRDFNLTRECVLGSRLDPHTPAYDVQQACGTGLEAAILVANKIALGQIEVGIAGGVDTTTDAPLARQRGPAPRCCCELNRGPVARRAARSCSAQLRPAQPFQPEIPRNAEPRTGLSMGEHAAITARRWGIDPRGAGRAGARARTSGSPPPTSAASSTTWSRRTSGSTRDQNLRPDSTLEKLAKLKPVFGTGRTRAATMTAGNSTPLTDGAVGRAARPARSGPRSTACRCWPSSSTPRPRPSTTCTATRAC